MIEDQFTVPDSSPPTLMVGARTYVAVDALLSDEAVERACVAFWGEEYWPYAVHDPADPEKWRGWMRNALAAALRTEGQNG